MDGCVCRKVVEPPFDDRVIDLSAACDEVKYTGVGWTYTGTGSRTYSTTS